MIGDPTYEDCVARYTRLPGDPSAPDIDYDPMVPCLDCDGEGEYCCNCGENFAKCECGPDGRDPDSCSECNGKGEVPESYLY